MKSKSYSACLRGIFVALAYAFLSGCVSQSVPNHGGGKRFFYEQALITKATDNAISQLDLAPLREAIGLGSSDKSGLDGSPAGNSGSVKSINLYVVAMGDEGGGFEGQSSSYGFSSVGSLFSGSNKGGGTSASGSNSSYSGSHAFANARDIEYLRAKLLHTLIASGIPIAVGGEDATGGDLYVLVSEFGTAKESFNLLIYSEAQLEARVAMQGFYVPHTVAGKASVLKSLGNGECTTEYLARYIFGTGPVGGARIRVRPGAIPAEVIGPDTPDPLPTRTHAKAPAAPEDSDEPEEPAMEAEEVMEGK